MGGKLEFETLARENGSGSIVDVNHFETGVSEEAEQGDQARAGPREEPQVHRSRSAWTHRPRRCVHHPRCRVHPRRNSSFPSFEGGPGPHPTRLKKGRNITTEGHREEGTDNLRHT